MAYFWKMEMVCLDAGSWLTIYYILEILEIKVGLVHDDIVLYQDKLAYSCTLSPCYVVTEIKIDNQYREPQWTTTKIALLGNKLIQFLSPYRYSNEVPFKWTIYLHLQEEVFWNWSWHWILVGESVMSRLSVHLLCLQSFLEVKVTIVYCDSQGLWNVEDWHD